jgi:hypothetical protein
MRTVMVASTANGASAMAAVRFPYCPVLVHVDFGTLAKDIGGIAINNDVLGRLCVSVT